MSMVAYSQADFETFGSGNWSNAGTWTVTSGTDIDYIPDADDNVTILDGHNVIVSGSDQEVKDLTLQGTTGTRLNVNGTTLNLFGTLKGPNSNFTNEILSTDGNGIIKFKGGNRVLFSTWSLVATTAAWLWRLEVTLDPGTTGTASRV